MGPEMSKGLDLVLSSIDKKYGKNTVMQFTDIPIIDPSNIISSGSIGLDVALGVGGYRKGRIVEVYGLESSGKTSTCLHAIANAQKQGMVCAFLDTEHALDPAYAQAIGVDLSQLLISQPDYAEQALDIADTMARSGEVGLIVVDSVAALVPQKELEGDMGDQHIGAQARLMSQAMRKLAGVLHQSNCLIIFVNQIRMKIGIMWGSPEVTSGGNALKFYASQRLDIRKIGQIKEGDKVIGNRTKVTVVKNKLAPPFRVAEFDIRFGVGIDKLSELADLAVEDGIIDKKGAWYSYNGEKLGQGKSNLVAMLEESEETRNEIRKQVRELRGLDTAITAREEKKDEEE